ncbi:MAG: PilN domain-containing protein [Desulfobulbaceae bacterium]|nr:PilN domain-containing protein [Desulfobulbaceae bacterium]
MTHINLLPVRQIRARLQVRNEIAIYLASIVFLLLALAMFSLNKISVSQGLQSDKAALTKERDHYQKYITETAKLKKDKKTQETKLNVIKKLKRTSQVSVHVMDEIANLTPANRLWLKTMSLSGAQLALAGTALDNATIAQFMNSISASTYFGKAALNKSSQTVVAGAKLKSFSLKIGVETPK